MQSVGKDWVLHNCFPVATDGEAVVDSFDARVLVVPIGATVGTVPCEVEPPHPTAAPATTAASTSLMNFCVIDVMTGTPR
jgi:hypothetical protein